ncbi:hypothetical protein H2198_006270 [Neophaeococcomyces mojaviensis]|uniref:Uncharacterized protein n=1 Tax=Neophaeococcomyces mojaviensis TaxID=3383035 RepID=A0ACC3A3H9_9EURO|nr:hypothetical protein H2198_006270 [Knufia sp. JES_112]
MPTKRPRTRSILSKENKHLKRRNETSKEKVVCTVDEVSNNDSGLQRVASGTTLVPANLPINVSGHFFEHVNATGDARVQLGDVYHYHEGKARIKYVEGATFDAYGQIHGACHPATRGELLQEIQDWAQRRGSKSIFWLNGMAGTGKSTISYTIAQWLTQQRPFGVVDLGASFFFKRGEGDRGSAALLFPTIIRQLSMKVTSLDVHVAKAIDANLDICSKSLGEQFNKLVREPLLQSGCSQRRLTYVVVIDALDECEREADIRIVLQLWSSLPQITNVDLRLFLTSRPELPIRLGFKKMSADAYKNMVLHEIPPPIIQRDILAFLKDALAEVREEYNLEPLSDTRLPDDWPGTKILQELTDMAVPLFIVAATIHRFVHDSNPKQRLENILKSRKLGQVSQMGQVYQPVLEQVAVSSRDKHDKEELYGEFRTIVGSIVTLAEPLAQTALAALLNISIETIALHLKPLHSVLQVPVDREAPVRPLHLSFGEFLTGQELRNQPFSVNNPATHSMLLTKCLKLLSSPRPLGLCENMCNLAYPGQPRRDLAPAIIQARLPPAVQYACRYWTHHAQHSGAQIHDDDKVHDFLQEHFLHWLEALSLLDRLAEAIEYVKTLQSLVSPQDSIHVSSFLDDAWRFVLANRYIGDLAPLQQYSSAIVFAPQTSVVKKVCGQVPEWIKQCPITPATWGLELQKLEGHMKEVTAVALSHDGSLLASGSFDKTVRLWNPTTGQEVQTLEGHTECVRAVAFSHDGSLLASASDDGTVLLWNPTTGQEVQRLEGHTNGVMAVAFSSDGSLLASASDDTVRLWNPTTGQKVQTLGGHRHGVDAVAFSPDGSLLASGSWDKTVRLWNPTTGQEVHTLEGHRYGVDAVAFSHDGSLLASASYGNIVRLWNPRTGQEVHTLKGHTKWVRAVAFSHDGSLLASASNDKTVRLWNPTTGQEVHTLEGHMCGVDAVAFSPDGSLLASTSEDKTLRLWSPITGREVQKLDGVQYVDKISFTVDTNSLLTNRGHIRVGIPPASTETLTSDDDDGGGDTLMLNDDWIEHAGHRILWLPQEYRSNVSAFCSSTLAIGQASGVVSFLQIKYR